MRAVVVGVLAALVLFVLFVGVDSVGAATYTQTCPSPSDYTAEAAVVAAQACAVQAERLEAIEAQLETNATVALSGDSQTALVDVRQLLGYLVGLVCLGIAFVPVFWRTFGRTV